MRLLQLFILALLTSAAWADSISFTSFDAQLSSLSFADDRLTYIGDFSPGRYFTPTTDSFGFCSERCETIMTTGPLIGKTGDSWIFEAGTISVFGGASVNPSPGIPTGTQDYTACASAGLGLNLIGGPPCLADGSFFGRFTGNITAHITGDTELYNGVANITAGITGQLLFSISKTLASAFGIAQGPYAGTYTAEGLLTSEQPLGQDLTGLNAIVNGEQDINGQAVPEPSAFLLMATALVAALLMRRANRQSVI